VQLLFHPDSRSIPSVNIVQITPGAGGMFCGNCLRDNALVAELRRLGHTTLFVPLYLPMRLDEADQSAGTPIFFNGISVYLDQKSPLFRKAPAWLRRVFDAPTLLKFAAGRAAKTRAGDVGDLTLSMLRGEDGNQARDLDELLVWLKTQPRPDAVLLSNALLVGMARRLRAELGAPIVCMLQGEDTFLDSLPEPARAEAWRTMAERCAGVDLFIAPSHYFGGLMGVRLGLRDDRLRVIYNGINLDGFSPAVEPPDPPVLGYFARMCREKGLEMLVEAYLLLRQHDRVKNLRLHVGGGCGPTDEPFVAELRSRLAARGVLGDVEFHPNLDRAQKAEFLRSLTVFSVPALYGEAFGLYVLEAMAAGVPVVQPRHAAFPEIIHATGGGVVCEPGDAQALATALEGLLINRIAARGLGESGRKAVLEGFSVRSMAGNILTALQELRR
jgi:glycosyltransferase involved in cell wall biosynthesis